ncbi:cytochrome P450 [Lentzea sp. NBRC 105346]|uniref:cytochrome P450 n=1 Tax=Lentzea sp. NBRC 105346 TaxID=3032205 RepID=UPI002556C899|nr:cytochrome P450 [Lentzea sp. NBRC 105346]GLZ33932.1 cytochrome P450 [Lentzea sp. NBRC 105346]
MTIPLAPKALPLAGHAMSLFTDPLGFLRSLPSCGDLVRIRIGPVEAIVICDPDLLRGVLLDDRTFDREGPIIDAVREAVGGGITTAPHRTHRRLRKLAQPAFHRNRMPGYAAAMTAEIDAVTASWRSGQVLDVPTELLNLTMTIIARTMFSGSLPAVVVNQAVEDLTTLLRGMYRRTLSPPWLNRLPIPANRRHVAARTRMERTIASVIASRRASGSCPDDLLSALITARDSTDALTDLELQEQVLTFFVSGSETSSNIMSWALHLLSLSPALAARVRAEVDAVLSGPATLDDLASLELTNRVILEVLRLYPPAWILNRVVSADTSLGGHSIPAGTTLVYSPYLIHHRADLYPSPSRFDPDRWLAAPPHPLTFVPFGGGARKCIGDQFGVVEATLVLATVMRRWELEPVGRAVRPSAALTLRPVGLRMRLKQR